MYPLGTIGVCETWLWINIKYMWVFWNYKGLIIDLWGININLQLAYYTEQYTIEYLIEDEVGDH